MIAPHFSMISSSIPNKIDLDDRIQQSDALIERYARDDQPLIGIGHSIGATILLALAGGEGETHDGAKLLVGSKWKFGHLALLTPPADFFRRPGALRSIHVPTRIWAGAKDVITPPEQALFLEQTLREHTQVDIRFNDQAGHFTYMDHPPPHAPEPHPDRDSFLAALAGEVAEFVTG